MVRTLSSYAFGSSTTTIASGESLSPIVVTGERTICAVVMPATWTTADLTFQVSDDGGQTWAELRDADGAVVTLASPTAGNRYNLSASYFQSSKFFKVRSGTVGSPVNQAGARVLKLITRKFYPMG